MKRFIIFYNWFFESLCKREEPQNKKSFGFSFNSIFEEINIWGYKKINGSFLSLLSDWNQITIDNLVSNNN